MKKMKSASWTNEVAAMETMITIVWWKAAILAYFLFFVGYTITRIENAQ